MARELGRAGEDEPAASSLLHRLPSERTSGTTSGGIHSAPSSYHQVPRATRSAPWMWRRQPHCSRLASSLHPVHCSMRQQQHGCRAASSCGDPCPQPVGARAPATPSTQHRRHRPRHPPDCHRPRSCTRGDQSVLSGAHPNCRLVHPRPRRWHRKAAHGGGLATRQLSQSWKHPLWVDGWHPVPR